MPDHDKIRKHKHLQMFGQVLHDPALWHLNRHSVARGFLVGVFVAFIPLPGQMIIAAALAIVGRANLPISVALVWLTNPLTIPPVFYSAYQLGTWIMGIPEQGFSFELSWQWLGQSMGEIWQPLFLGSMVCGVAGGILGYTGIQWMWRVLVIRRWKGRYHHSRESAKTALRHHPDRGESDNGR